MELLPIIMIWPVTARWKAALLLCLLVVAAASAMMIATLYHSFAIVTTTGTTTFSWKENAVMIHVWPAFCNETLTTHFVAREFDNIKRQQGNLILSDFLAGPGVDDNNTLLTTSSSVGQPVVVAACRFLLIPNSNHFPHACQQLYRCWSFWRAVNASHYPHRTVQPVLIWPHKVYVSYFNPSQQSLRTRLKKKGESGFSKSLIHAWQETIGLNVVLPDHPIVRENENSIVYNKDVEGAPFVLASPEDARALANSVLSHPNYKFLANEPRSSTFLHVFPEERPMAGCPENGTLAFPRIGVLNRELTTNRTLINVDMIVADLERSLGLPHQSIPVAYFEGRNLLEQLSLMASIDLLVSPHGAQLTSLPFMPACGGVFEIFPTGYYIPWYFGSLADAAGLRHYSVYVSTTGKDDLPCETAVSMYNASTRKHARTVPLCPQSAVVSEVVQKMVQDWRECCLVLR